MAEIISNEKIQAFIEEYQNAKEREDSYAEKTSRYQDVSGALKCLIDDANFQGNHTLLQEVKLCLLGL